MDAARVDGRGGWMPFSLEGMDARKRKLRSSKRPVSPAQAQARRRLRRSVKFEGGSLKEEPSVYPVRKSSGVVAGALLRGEPGHGCPQRDRWRQDGAIPFLRAIEGSEFGRKAAAERGVSGLGSE